MRGSVGKSTWVCFDCRRAVRRPTHGASEVPCSGCRERMRCLGYKIRIPSKSDAGAWQRLRESLADDRIAGRKRKRNERVRRIHDLEQAAARLELRPANRERARLIRTLRATIESLRDP